MQILSKEKQGAVVYGSFLATLGLCAHIACNQESQRLESPIKLDSSALVLRSSEISKSGLDYVELRGQFRFIGSTPQKTFTQYVSSTGAPLLEATRNVYIYNCLDQKGVAFLVASQKELPTDLEFVKGKVHESSRYLGDATLTANSPDFLQVDFFKSRSVEGLQGARVLFNTVP